MADTDPHIVGELAAVQQVRLLATELATTQAKLNEERRRNAENLDQRLAGLDRGQATILEKIEEFPNKYINQNDYDKLEGDVKSQGKLIYVGLGIVLVIDVAIGLLAIVIKWH